MGKENYTSNLLLSMFFLREQLNTYIDIFENQKPHLTKHLGHETISDLLENKRLILGLAENKYEKLLNAGIQDAALFHPPEQMWMELHDIDSCRNAQCLVQLLLEFDQKVMEWCYLFMTDEHTGLHDTGYFLTMIQYAKSGVDLVLREQKKSN